jgi:long-chain fatty acid transport protein
MALRRDHPRWRRDESRLRPFASLALTLLLAAPAKTAAQATAQIPLQFDFMNPGARSMGLGGAFIAAADDATAAFGNPSGLAFLTAPELSIEGRFKKIETPFLERGRVGGTITGAGLDTIATAIRGISVDRDFGPTFLSGILPIGRVTLAGYRHEVATLDNAFFSTGVFEQETTGGIIENRARDRPLSGRRTIAIRNYGGAIGIRFNDRFAIGGGLSVYTFDLVSDFRTFSLKGDYSSDVDTTKITATAAQRGSAAAPGGNAGALWLVGRGVKLAGMFRRGPSFTFSQVDRDLVGGDQFTREGRFKVPDVWGGGVEWRRSDSLRVVGDISHVRYSQLKTDFIDFQAISSGRQAQLRIADGTEVHVGVERLFLNTAVPLAVRLGAWFDPDHAVRYIPSDRHDRLDIRLSAALPGGEDLFHVTGGGGVAPTRWLELNVAVDFSSRTRYATASAVVRFP